MRVLFTALVLCCAHIVVGQTKTITMTNYSFQPSALTVTPGTKVTWVNKANMQHTSTSGTACKPDGKWNSGNVDSGKSFTYTFETPGTYNFFCIPHCAQGMTGVIEVKGSGSKTGTNPEKKNDSEIGDERSDAAAPTAAPTAAAGVAVINIDNYSFEPADITVPPGTKVTWHNRANTVHTTTSGTGCAGDGKWNSGNLDQGALYSYTFQEEGTYNYFCIPHCSMGMTGVVHVKAGAAAPTGQEVTATSARRKKGPVPGFKSLDIINAPSTYVLGKNVLDFSIYHRFDDISGANGGGQVLFGLDNMRDVRLALAYGLTKRITIGFGRSKGDWFNTPYQEVKNLYDGSVRVAVLKQDTSRRIPVSVTVFGNTVYCAMKAQPGTGTEADFIHPSDRFSHSAQVMISHDFAKHLTIQVMPAYVRRNWVNVCAGSKDNLDMFALGGAARWALTRKLALIGEYYYVFSDYHRDNKDHFYNPLAVGLEINTGGHVFHINLSNSTGIIPNTYIPYTTESWQHNGFRFGFSITRKFNMNNIKHK